jgi:hypothetical protein
VQTGEAVLPAPARGFLRRRGDGQRFLLVERIDPDIRAITLIQNWATTPRVD